MNYKNIIIYGGSSEISFELVKKFINNCEKLVIFCRNKNNLLESYNLNEVDKGKIVIHETNIQDLNKNLDIIKNLQNISGVFWISGYTGDGEKEYNDIFQAKENIEVNFTNPSLIINEISKKIIKNSNSFISVFTSVAGLRGRKKQLFYSSSRSGLITYLSGLRQRLFKDKILVMTVIPGYMNTKPFRNSNIKAPNFLITQPNKVTKILLQGIKKRKAIVYINFYWKIIMTIVKIIPEKIFKKLSF